MSVAVLSIFAGSTLVAREIEKQTVLTLLAKPVSRTQFIVGKYFGLALVVVSVMLGLSCVLAFLLNYLELHPGAPFFAALFGILAEALLLIAIAIFFGSFARPMMTGCPMVISRKCFISSGKRHGRVLSFPITLFTDAATINDKSMELR